VPKNEIIYFFTSVPINFLRIKEVVTMEVSMPLSPESLTAVEILENIDASHRNQALEMLRSFAYELRSEQRWEELYKNHPGPMKKMAKQAIKDHKEGKSRRL
jgi:hypothetical protein